MFDLSRKETLKDIDRHIKQIYKAKIFCKLKSRIFVSSVCFRLLILQKLYWFLLGNKNDIKDGRQVSREEAEKLSRCYGDIPYFEITTQKEDDVENVRIGFW